MCSLIVFFFCLFVCLFFPAFTLRVMSSLDDLVADTREMDMYSSSSLIRSSEREREVFILVCLQWLQSVNSFLPYCNVIQSSRNELSLFTQSAILLHLTISVSLSIRERDRLHSQWQRQSLEQTFVFQMTDLTGKCETWALTKYRLTSENSLSLGHSFTTPGSESCARVTASLLSTFPTRFPCPMATILSYHWFKLFNESSTAAARTGTLEEHSVSYHQISIDVCTSSRTRCCGRLRNRQLLGEKFQGGRRLQRVDHQGWAGGNEEVPNGVC